MANSTRRPHASRFLAFAAIVTAIMFVGFARNYYLRTWLGTHVLSLTAHVHGLIMTCWVLLFLAQALLVSTARVDLHRRLGAAGAALAALVVAFGLYTIHGDIERQYPGASPIIQAEGFVAFDGISLLIFGGLVVTALIARQQPEKHRRLMILALISLLPPAFGRLVAYFTHQHVEEIVLGLMTASVISVGLFDALHRGRLHVVFLVGGAVMVAVNVLTYIAQVI